MNLLERHFELYKVMLIATIGATGSTHNADGVLIFDEALNDAYKALCAWDHFNKRNQQIGCSVEPEDKLSERQANALRALIDSKRIKVESACCSFAVPQCDLEKFINACTL